MRKTVNWRRVRDEIRTGIARVLVFVALVVIGAYACAPAASGEPVAQVAAVELPVVFGTYDTPCGVVTVYGDYSGNYADNATYPLHDGWPARSAVTVLSVSGLPIVGTYETPCGVVTVYSDSSGRYDPYGEPGACSRVDWVEIVALAESGVGSLPVDVNGDGFISCTSDSELGS